MKTDRYYNFTQLASQEREGVDYLIRSSVRVSSVAIIAPHGGFIEPGTSQIAEFVAGTSFSFYSFEGLRNRPHSELHITSTRFDEPICLELIGRCDAVIAIHGLAGAREEAHIGGLAFALRNSICKELRLAGFLAHTLESGRYAATAQNNVCNRGATSQGVQLELTRELRNSLVQDEKKLLRFASSIWAAIDNQSKAN